MERLDELIDLYQEKSTDLIDLTHEKEDVEQVSAPNNFKLIDNMLNTIKKDFFIQSTTQLDLEIYKLQQNLKKSLTINEKLVDKDVTINKQLQKLRINAIEQEKQASEK